MGKEAGKGDQPAAEGPASACQLGRRSHNPTEKPMALQARLVEKSCFEGNLVQTALAGTARRYSFSQKNWLALPSARSRNSPKDAAIRRTSSGYVSW